MFGKRERGGGGGGRREIIHFYNLSDYIVNLKTHKLYLQH